MKKFQNEVVKNHKNWAIQNQAKRSEEKTYKKMSVPD